MLKLRDVVWWASRSLLEARARSILTIIGILIGAALIVAVTSVSKTYTKTITELMLSGWNPRAVYVYPRRAPLTQADIAILSSIKHVTAVVPVNVITCTMYAAGGAKSVEVMVIPTPYLLYKAYPQIRVKPKYAHLAPGSILVGEDLAYPIGEPPFAPIGTKAILSCLNARIMVTVAGVIRRGVMTYMWPPLTRMVVALESTVPVRLSGYGELIVVADSLKHVEEVAAEARSLLGSRAFIIAPTELAKSLSQAMSRLGLLVAAISGVSMLVAGLSIAATMMMSVYQRLYEIAILKTFGFTRLQILSLFLAEAMLIGLIGSVLGAAIGVGLGYLLCNLVQGLQLVVGMKVVYQVAYEWIPLTIGLSLLVALVAGIYPAMKAASVEPVKILRMG